MKRGLWLISVGLLSAVPVVLAQDGTGAAAPKYSYLEPSIVANSWEVDLEFKTPMRLVKQINGRAKPVYYYYMVYTVTNNSGKEVDWLPRFQLVDDALQTHNAQLAISPALFEEIKKLHHARFLEYPLKAAGKLLKGADNAKDSVAIFELDRDPKHFKIIVSGLSGEQTLIYLPTRSDAETALAAVNVSSLAKKLDFPGTDVDYEVRNVGKEYVFVGPATASTDLAQLTGDRQTLTMKSGIKPLSPDGKGAQVYSPHVRTIVLVSPQGKSSKVSVRPVLRMEKARVISFDVPGQTGPDELPPVKEIGDSWVMKQAPPDLQVQVDLAEAAQAKTVPAVQTSDGQPLGTPTKESPAKVPPPAPAPAPAPSGDSALDQPMDPTPANPMTPAPATQPEEMPEK
ncbi:MAG: hypothetical protein BIFFINMI_02683 [Phycisphaerae bacterium]|nr:hypothetical protein [Phycisphaerae bacterium]